MLIIYNPDEWETISEVNTCEYHRRNPGQPWAGCTCSASIGQRRKKRVEKSWNESFMEIMKKYKGAWEELAKT